MRVPRDQGLFLTIFLTLCLVATVAMWLFLPVHHVVESDEGGGEQTELFTLPEAVTPEGRLIRMEKALAMASAVISKVEGTGKDKANDKAAGKAKGKTGGKVSEKSSEKSGEKGKDKEP